jgi:hypothetical protein
MKFAGKLALLNLAFALLASAQEFRGKIQGFVSDTSGAAMVGVDLTLANAATGVVLRSKTNVSGAYIFDFLSSGTYVLSGEMKGFSKVVQESIQVGVRAAVEVNLTMSVGAMAETVTVQGAPPDLKFESSSIDTVVGEKLIQTLPQEARNPFALAMLEPSVRSGAGGSGGMEPFMVWGGSSISVGGTNQRQGELLIDGAPSKVSTMTGYVPASIPLKNSPFCRTPPTLNSASAAAASLLSPPRPVLTNGTEPPPTLGAILGSTHGTSSTTPRAPAASTSAALPLAIRSRRTSSSPSTPTKSGNGRRKAVD